MGKTDERRRHARARAVFEEALRAPPEARGPVLDRACAGDEALRADVEALLAVHDAPDPALEPARVAHGLREDVQAAMADTPEAPLPERIGSCRVVGVLGAGGMGTVYEAEQDSPRRRVAVKVLRGELASPAILARFQREADLLGRLVHPGIAQIHEVGTEGNQPHLIMELVRGQPITEHVESAGLSDRERLRLLVKVCEAVEHAHANGVIHRDLKPANILVDESGQPKVLDFGVAKAESGERRTAAPETGTGMLVGTLRYMSPEQVTGRPEDIDTRSDIWALGVIAFELLTGRSPLGLEDKGIPESLRIIAEARPDSVTSWRRELRGDVATILSTALAPERSRRYQSVAQLRSDIERHLNDEPITARPPSASYQLAKFARRNKVLVGSALAMLALLLVAVGGTSAGLVRAERERERAERAAGQAEAVRQFFLNVLVAPVPGEEGRDATVVEALEHAQRTVDESFAHEPGIRADVHAELGRTFFYLGRHERAEEQLRQALSLRRTLLGEEHPDTIDALSGLGLVLTSLSQAPDDAWHREGRELQERALVLSRRVTGPTSESTVNIIGNLAHVHRSRGDAAATEALVREALDIARAREEASGGGDRRVARSQVASQSLNLAVLLRERGALDEAESLLRELRDQALRDGEHEEWVGRVSFQLASVTMDLGRLEEAEAALRLAVAEAERSHGRSGYRTLVRHDRLAECLRRLGRVDEAITAHRSVLERARSELGPTHRATLAWAGNHADTLAAAGRLADAAAAHRDVVARCQSANGPSAVSTLEATARLAEFLVGTEWFPEARELAEDGLAIVEAQHGEAGLLASRFGLVRARALVRRGEATAADRLLDDLLEDVPEPGRHLDGGWRAHLGALAVALRDRGRLEDAAAVERTVSGTDS